MCFFNKANAITSLLNQLMLTAPKTFPYKNINGATEENAIEIEEEDETKET